MTGFEPVVLPLCRRLPWATQPHRQAWDTPKHAQLVNQRTPHIWHMQYVSGSMYTSASTSPCVRYSLTAWRI